VYQIDFLPACSATLSAAPCGLPAQPDYNPTSHTRRPPILLLLGWYCPDNDLRVDGSLFKGRRSVEATPRNSGLCVALADQQLILPTPSAGSADRLTFSRIFKVNKPDRLDNSSLNDKTFVFNFIILLLQSWIIWNNHSKVHRWFLFVNILLFLLPFHSVLLS